MLLIIFLALECTYPKTLCFHTPLGRKKGTFALYRALLSSGYLVYLDESKVLIDSHFIHRLFLSIDFVCLEILHGLLEPSPVLDAPSFLTADVQGL